MIQDFVSCFSAPCQALIDATVVQLHYLDFLLETTNVSDFYKKTMCTSLVSCHFEQEFTVDCIILFSASCLVNSHGFQIARNFLFPSSQIPLQCSRSPASSTHR
jgi:hypothetical protein